LLLYLYLQPGQKSGVTFGITAIVIVIAHPLVSLVATGAIIARGIVSRNSLNSRIWLCAFIWVGWVLYSYSLGFTLSQFVSELAVGTAPNALVLPEFVKFK
jgi:hypothetical protein